jgi:hypothetical protein
MTISQAQLRTLNLLHKEAAYRVYRSRQAGEYTWIHEHANIPLTATLHRLFSSGHATVSSEDRDRAIITEKGRAFLANAA